jgi:hypothetical protein
MRQLREVIQMRALRVIVVIAVTYPLWGVVYEVVTGYWPPNWMTPWIDHTRPGPCRFCGGGAPG